MRTKHTTLFFKFPIRSVAIASIVSLVIGTVFFAIATGKDIYTLADYVFNAGYSINLGLGLFLNGTLFSIIERRFIKWLERPFISLVIALAFHFLYSSIVIAFTNWLWFIVIYGYTISGFLSGWWYVILGEYVILVCITAIIYAKSFFNEWRQKVIQTEALKKEAIALQYQIMQNQVNPHFLFNSLNVLGSLIDIDTEKAKHFTRELSQFYRELLHFKDKDLIPLSEEIDFVKKYIYLQKIRFGQNFNVDIQLPEKINGEVIPMSVQLLVENAVKHNIIANSFPLTVRIYQPNENEITVENNLQKKENTEGSNKIGIKNLTERYKFLTNKEMVIEQTTTVFRVTFPIVNIES